MQEGIQRNAQPSSPGQGAVPIQHLRPACEGIGCANSRRAYSLPGMLPTISGTVLRPAALSLSTSRKSCRWLPKATAVGIGDYSDPGDRFPPRSQRSIFPSTSLMNKNCHSTVKVAVVKVSKRDSVICPLKKPLPPQACLFP